jgi:hypothetical protein
MSTPHAATLRKAEAAITDAWLAGLPGRNADILGQASAEQLSQQGLDAARRYWGERREAETRTDPAHGKTAWAVYLWGAPGNANLADALRAAAKSDGYAGNLSVVRTGVRYALALPDYCNEAKLLAGATQVSASQLQDLPDRVFEVALTRGSGQRQSGYNLRSQMRGFLRWAVTNRVLPICFTARVTRTPWDDVADAVWPNPRQRTTAATYRAAWHKVAAIASELHGREIQPNDLTSAHIKAIWGRILASGHPRLADTARSAISAAGKAGHLRQWTRPQHRRTGQCLTVPDGISIEQDPWGALSTALNEAGFPSEFSEFFAWFQQYRTLESKAMRRRRAEFPRRPPHKQLRPGSQIQYVRSILRWLGSAGRELGAPSSLTLIQVFGRDFPKVLTRFEEEVETAAKTGRCSPHGSGARNVIVCACAIASDLYAYIRHRDGHSLALNQSSSGERVDLQAELRKDVAPDLRTLLEAYKEGFVAVAELSEAAKAANETGKSRNSVRHMETTVDRFSFQGFWVPLLDAALEALSQAAKGERSPAFHLTVRHTFQLALAISTAARPREMCIAVIGDHYQPQSENPTDVLHLPAGLRKNAVAHDSPIIRRFLPNWLEELHMESRAYFLSRNPDPTDADRLALFLCRAGRALAAPGMSEADIKSGVCTLRAAFRNFVAKTAAAAGLTPPTDAGYRGMYTIRGAAGDFVNSHSGSQEAAKLLGNHPRTAAVAYASRSGRDIRHDEFLTPIATVPLSAAEEALATDVAAYRALLQDGSIDAETFAVMVRKSQQRHAA